MDSQTVSNHHLRGKPTAVKAEINRLNAGSVGVDDFKKVKIPAVPERVELDAQIRALDKSKGNPIDPVKTGSLRPVTEQKKLPMRISAK